MKDEKLIADESVAVITGDSNKRMLPGPGDLFRKFWPDRKPNLSIRLRVK
jgi:hypothetical protein